MMINGFWPKSLFVASLLLLEAFLLPIRAEAESSKNSAPEWVISEWINSDGFTLTGLRGKVVIIDFFQ